ALTEPQKTALKDSWKLLAGDGKTMMKSGALLFGLLFKSHPDTKKHFKHFDDATFATMDTGVGKAHGMAVFTGLGAFVSSIDDDACVNGLAKKLSRNHTARGITADDFKLLQGVFKTFLDEATGKKATNEHKAAWDALLTMLIKAHS
uniref:Globin n=1 Tax=Buccinum undatum TaxID=37541 RepID=GLB_BUCUU|nr:RecName: Full=Globin; AltName: Full=Myoglobin [Buccinum undatum]pir/A44588/ globin - waved whelk (Buccinum undatum) [Buccinum undatum]prf//2022171A myoglobin [Buccinum undatum]